MRTTYLLQEKQLDGSTCLVETTAENWHAIVRACAKLPQISAATFIRDVIPDDKGVDCMFIETTKETWQEWDREQRRIRDNLQHRKQYEHIPVESMLTMQDDILANAGLESEDIADSAGKPPHLRTVASVSGRVAQVGTDADGLLYGWKEDILYC